MAQIFHRSTNTISRLTIYGALLASTLMAFFLGLAPRSPYFAVSPNYGIAPGQPVPFSHKTHVGGDGIDCRYCHTSVETSSFAGLPDTKICMNCHSQLWTGAPMLEPVRESNRTGKSLVWTRVNDLPDYVYFDHSIHVNKGVGCGTCHGPVDRMPLTYQAQSLLMEWCLDCHRAPEKYLRPREQVFNMEYDPPSKFRMTTVTFAGRVFENQEDLGRTLVKAYKLRSVQDITSCSTCHR